LLEVLFKDNRFQWQRLESLLAAAKGAEGMDWQPVLGSALSYLFSSEGQFLRHQLILALTEDDRLHFAEVGRLWELVREQIRPRALLQLALQRG